MISELQAAIEDLKEKEIIWGLVDPSCEEAAYNNMRAAKERVNTLIKEMKEGVKNDVCSIGRSAVSRTWNNNNR